MVDRQAFLDRWSDLHEGINPSGVAFLRGWLSLVYVLARPLASARVSPSAVTFAGLLVGIAAVPVTSLGGRWPLLATVLVLASGVVDSLDGAVAVLRDRVTRWGALLDAVCDRIADTAYGAALWILGAPAGLALAWVVASFLAEYARARGQALLLGPIDVVTVGERPTRIIVTVITLLAGGLVPSRANDAATVGVVVAATTATAGVVQVLVAVRRRLS